MESTTAKIKAVKALNTAKETVTKYKKTTAAALAGVLTLGYFGFSSNDVPVHKADLYAAPSKFVATGETGNAEIVVGSYKKLEGRLILNNHKDYKQATMSVVLDFSSAPELASIDPRTLRGKSIKARGERATYDGKPQIVVRNADDFTMKASVAEEHNAKK
jgi:hypothetical protein